MSHPTIVPTVSSYRSILNNSPNPVVLFNVMLYTENIKTDGGDHITMADGMMVMEMEILNTHYRAARQQAMATNPDVTCTFSSMNMQLFYDRRIEIKNFACKPENC